MSVVPVLDDEGNVKQMRSIDGMTVMVGRRKLKYSKRNLP
jgi:hypothetical protein